MSEDLSYSRPNDILALMLDGFLTIEEGRAKYQAAGGDMRSFETFVKQRCGSLISDEDAD